MRDRIAQKLGAVYGKVLIQRFALNASILTIRVPSTSPKIGRQNSFGGETSKSAADNRGYV